MRWLSSHPVSLEHATALWLVRRFVDPEAVVEIAASGSGVVTTGEAEVLGPATKLRPFLRKYRLADAALGKRIEADVLRAQQELASGLTTSWAPELQRAFTCIKQQPCLLEDLESCFDQHFGTASVSGEADGWASDMLQVMPIGTMLIDAAGTVRLANPKMGELVAMPTARIIGEDIRSIPLEWVDRSGHKVLEFSSLIASAIQHRRRYDKILTRSPRDLFLATSIQPVSSAARPDPRLMVTCVDNTDQVLLEQAAQSREQRVHYLLNTLPFGVMEFNPHGEIIYANAGLHRMFNYPLGSLLGQPTWFTKSTPVDESAIRDRYQQMLERRQQPQSYISRVVTRHGSEFEVRVDWGYRADEGGEASGFIATMTDLTEDSLRRTEFSRLLRNQAEARTPN